MTIEDKVDKIDGKIDKVLEELKVIAVARAQTEFRLNNHAKRLGTVEEVAKGYVADRNKVIGGAFVGGGVFGAIGGFLVYLFEHHK